MLPTPALLFGKRSRTHSCRPKYIQAFDQGVELNFELAFGNHWFLRRRGLLLIWEKPILIKNMSLDESGTFSEQVSVSASIQ